MKNIFLPVLLCMSLSSMAQNPLLKNPAKGTVSLNDATNICMVSDGTNVVLVAGGSTGLYAIDIADNNKLSEKDNTLTAAIPSFVSAKLNPVVGQNLTVLDMEVNPLSKAIYVLAKASTNKYLIKVENKGAKISAVDLSNISYSKLSWTGNFSLNDMAYGNNTLYVSSGSFSLDGEIGWVAPPFAHNSSFTKRSTTMFKSNWGNMYVTTAPLEVIAVGSVAGKNRLMGVTTCAPGFSVDVANLSGSGVLSVTEDFNIHQGFSAKAIYMNHDQKEWLFDLHDNNIYRIGKKYLDGSQVAANKHNQNATMLRDNMGTVIPSLPADDIKLIGSNISIMAFHDNYRLLILESGATGALKLTQVSSENPPPPAGIKNVSSVAPDLYPNPASHTVNIQLPENNDHAQLHIVAVDGKVVLSQELNTGITAISIDTLPAGSYVVNIKLADGTTSSRKLTIE